MRKRLLSLAAVALVASACGARPRRAEATSQRPDRGTTSRLPPPAPAASAYDGNTFKDPGKNPVTDTDEDRVSTFAMDVDTASYTIAQRYVADGNVPDPASVRVEEWVNAFDQGYEPPRQATFAVARRRRPDAVLASRRGAAPGRHPGPRVVASGRGPMPP